MGFSGCLFLALSFTQILIQFNLSSAQIHVYDFCLGENYTENSRFGANLNLLLSSISNFNIPSNSRFYYAGEGDLSDRVYGLFQCRGDYASAECKKCAETSTSKITTLCPFRREAVGIYDECWLHYSDKSFLSTPFYDPMVILRNTANVSDPVRFKAKIGELMKRLLVQATNKSFTLFAVDKVNVTSYEIYGLVQCTQDLSEDNCTRCLRTTISHLPECCSSSKGGQVIVPSCRVRYEMYDFLSTGAIIAPALPPPHISPFLNNTNSTTGQEKMASRKVATIVASTLSVVVFVSTISVCFYVRRWLKQKNHKDLDEMRSAESVQFNFRTIREATDDFSDSNKLGKGGFGIVYKGVLHDGQEIAVKRLSRNSGQGLEEFENEVLLIVKLQHKNLVRLLGFCLEGHEKLLIYEFAPNASLDQYIFDRTKSAYLDWERRYKIIGGIARGLLYLHEDSRHRIIHRDLKTGNILLDAQMEPKISDFGMARLFGMDQTEGRTGRVVGTYGYMAPEYAMYGQFSVKSDVFSFGVLILEIITGLKNRVFFHAEHSEDLLTHAWRHWGTGTAIDIIEPALKGNYSRDGAMRCIHIGLLCVQDNIDLRPTMTTVVHMLNRDSVALPLPSTPAFFVNSKDIVSIFEHGEHSSEGNKLKDELINHSTNEVSMTELQAR